MKVKEKKHNYKYLFNPKVLSKQRIFMIKCINIFISHLLQLGQEAVQSLVGQLTHLEHGDRVALQVL